MPVDLEALTTRCRGGFASITDDRARPSTVRREPGAVPTPRGRARTAVLEHRLGHNLILFGEVERGRALEEPSLARSLTHGFLINEAMCRASVGELEYAEGDVERGLALIAASLKLAREVGYQLMQANLLNALAGYTFQQGRTDEAERYARSALAVARDMGDRRHAFRRWGSSPPSPPAAASQSAPDGCGERSRPSSKPARSDSARGLLLGRGS